MLTFDRIPRHELFLDSEDPLQLAKMFLRIAVPDAALDGEVLHVHVTYSAVRQGDLFTDRVQRSGQLSIFLVCERLGVELGNNSQYCHIMRPHVLTCFGDLNLT